MKKIECLILVLLLAMSCFLPATVSAEAGTVYIVGDGVCALQGEDVYPRQGWGEFLQGYVDKAVINCARNDADIKSYIESGAWQEVLSKLSASDSVMIAFGADSINPAKSENYYSAYLLKYGLDAKKKGASVIYVTPAAVGSTVYANQLIDPLTNSVKSVAKTLSCPVADLNGAMRKNYIDYQGLEKEGKMKASTDTLFVSRNQNIYYEQFGSISEYAKQKAEEKEHKYFTEVGARFAARTVVNELYAQGVSWARDLSDAENRTSYANKVTGMDSGTTYGVFMDGMEYNGLPTQVFAYVGLPKDASKENPVPAMVLVHGAAGHAYQDWVQHWNNKGYAAISFYWREPDSKYDNTMPDGTALKYTEGPRRSDISDSVATSEKENQFMYHATSDISLAYNLLNQMPEVQKGQIGLTGISWGGIISSRGLGEDTRFKFAMPIYGCGNLDIGIGSIRPTSSWDGKHTFPNAVKAEMPVFWVNGSNDTFFSLNAMAKSVQDTNGDVLILLGNEHSQQHGAGMTGAMNEIFAYADYYLKGGEPLPKITDTSLNGKTATFTVQADNGIEKARLIYNTTGLVYADGKGATEWEIKEITLKPGKNTVTAPSDAKGFYVELTDKKGLRKTTEYLEVK